LDPRLGLCLALSLDEPREDDVGRAWEAVFAIPVVALALAAVVVLALPDTPLPDRLATPGSVVTEPGAADLASAR